MQTCVRNGKFRDFCCKFLRRREITCTYLHYFQAITVETKLLRYKTVKFSAWLTHLGQVGKLDPSAVRTCWEVIAASLRRQLAGERSWVSPPSVKPLSAGPRYPWLRAALDNKSFFFLN